MTARRFEVERYLEHQATKFRSRFDANCWLLLSRCMDLMDIGYQQGSYAAGLKRIDPVIDTMLLPVEQDALIPAGEMEKIAE